MKSVRLQSSDGEVCVWPQQVALRCPVLKEMVDLCEESDDEASIPVPFRSIILDQVKKHLIVDKFDWDFHDWLSENTPMAIEVLHAADFFEVEELKRTAARVLLNKIIYKSVKEVRIAFGVKPGQDPLRDMPRRLKLEVLAEVALQSQTAERAVAVLDELPAVCEEWADLVRDPAVFMEVRLDSDRHLSLRHFRDAEDVGEVVLHSARRGLRDALRLSKLVVHHKMEVDLAKLEPQAHALALDMLWRSRSVLREAHLRHIGKVLCDSQGRSIWEILACMESLRKLELVVDKPLEYRGELAGKLADLTCLTWAGPPNESLLADLLGAAKDSVEELNLLGMDFLDVVLLVVVLQKCQAIRVYRGPNVLDVKKCWPGLEVLEVTQ